jgi:CheY-like chemotaxis protein
VYPAVVHLLTNAVEALDGRAGRIRISLGRVERETRAWIRLTVADEGVGLDRETRCRIFEPYFSTRSEQGGAGLGLTFVQRVVSEMEGRIAVESEQGQGTTFAILLPVGGEVPEHEPVEQVAVAEPIATTLDAPAARRGERVLFVDDDASVLDVGRQMLESLGYEVTACPSAMAALELLADASNEYELLLTDLTMPGMTGIDLARETRRMRPQLPIVCCTGFGDEKTERRGLAAGMNAFVRKPIDYDTFASTIRTTIDRFGAPRA